MELVVMLLIGVFVLAAFIILLFGVLIFTFMKTHALVELKAMLGGKSIGVYFSDNSQVEWKAVTVDSGIINDKNYGSHIVNGDGAYTDKKTKAIILPLDSGLAVGSSVKAFHAADQLSKAFQDKKALQNVRMALLENKNIKIIKNDGEEDEEVFIDMTSEDFGCLRESINFSSLRSLLSAITPHNISAKIEKTVIHRMKGMGSGNLMSIAVPLLMVLGGVGLMAMILWLTLGSK